MTDLQDNHAVNIRVGGHSFKVQCAQDHVHELLEAAELVNQTVDSARQGGRVLGSEKVALLAALRIAHQLKHLEKQNVSLSRDIQTQLQAMTQKIYGALGDTLEP